MHTHTIKDLADVEATIPTTSNYTNIMYFLEDIEKKNPSTSKHINI